MKGLEHMTLSMNNALDSVVPSGIRRFNALAKQTPGCILLTLGEPEFNTPEAIKAEVPVALDKNMTHYPPNNGEGYLLDALSQHMEGEGLKYRSDEIIVTCGATEALYATFMAMLNPGDEVIIPVPAFVLYESIVRMCRAVPVLMDTTADGFQITEENLRESVSERTKAIVLTSPNNPTGCVLTAETLDAVARVAEETEMFVICDDVYHQLTYKDDFERFAVRHPELRPQTVVVDSYSKPYAMTGWRLGWLGADGPIKKVIQKVHQYAVVSVPAFVQTAAVTALDQDISEMRETYSGRRDYVVKRLRDMGFDLFEPEGAFYVFPSVKKYGLTSEEFCERLIREGGVGLVPGVFFGTEGFVRLSFCCAQADIEEALNRIEKFLQTL